MSRPEIIRFLIFRTIGNFLLLFAIFGVFMTFGPALYYEVMFRTSEASGVHYVVGSSNTPQPVGQATVGFGQLLGGSKQQILIPKDTDFDVLIPKIGANVKVFPNVDSSNEDEYLKILQQGVAHARGTVFPGMAGNIYLFAHSTDNWWNVGRYNAVFYLLKDLSVGDDVVVFFQDQRHNYSVTSSTIVDPSDVSALTQSHGGPEQLVLQTCWPPGTSWKRLLVFAKPKSNTAK
ncbi:MAG TPA: sortase [Candidatus Saccharimonadales bacterium]|nr:sortase [Candidatus Saccharimonadales bacterium]